MLPRQITQAQRAAQALQTPTVAAVVAVALQTHHRTHLGLVVQAAQADTQAQTEQRQPQAETAEQAEQVFLLREAAVLSEGLAEERAVAHTDMVEQALLATLQPYRTTLTRLLSQLFWAICKAVVAAQADTIIPAPRMAAVVVAEVALGQPAPTEPQEAITARLLLVVLAEKVLLFSKELHNKNRGETLGYFYSLEKR